MSSATLAAAPPAPKTATILAGKCDHKPGAVRLDRYPNLTYAPAQHGEGIRTHLKGVKVDDLAASAKAAGLLAAIDAEASKHGVDLEELLDALRYARAHKLV